MKKLLMLIVGISVVLTNIAFADANLRMNISGAGNDNRYFLCLTNSGCLSILLGKKGRVFPITSGTIDNIYTVNMGDRRIYSQPLPSSCSMDIQPDQTLTVSGNLVGGRLANLHCTVS